MIYLSSCLVWLNIMSFHKYAVDEKSFAKVARVSNFTTLKITLINFKVCESIFHSNYIDKCHVCQIEYKGCLLWRYLVKFLHGPLAYRSWDYRYCNRRQYIFVAWPCKNKWNIYGGTKIKQRISYKLFGNSVNVSWINRHTVRLKNYAHKSQFALLSFGVGTDWFGTY